MNTYIIMGTGNSAQNVIEDSLNDLPKPRTFQVIVEKTKEEGISRVYDWLLDNNEEFVAHKKNDDVPKILLTSAKSVVDPCRISSTSKEFIKETVDSGATVLYLWNDKDSAGCEKEVLGLLDDGVTVKDLTQGLTPFLVEFPESGSHTEKTKPVVKNDVVDTLEPFTRKDYESMPKWTIDSQAKAQGLNTMGLDKEKSIDLLCGLSNTTTQMPILVIAVLSDGTVVNHMVDESAVLALFKK